ncbi:MAG: hypothetical protein AAF501_03475 [Pseudomonadota bacterium]
MNLTAILEDFGTETSAPAARREAGEPVEMRIAKIRGRALAEGFAEGVASVQAKQDDEERRLLSQIAEAFADSKILRDDLENRMAEVVSTASLALIDAIAPGLVGQRLADEVFAALRDAFNEFSDAGTTVFVAPERVASISDFLTTAGLAVHVEADPQLDSGSARVDWASGFEQIEVTSLITRATALLSEHLEKDARHQPDLERRRAVHE